MSPWTDLLNTGKSLQKNAKVDTLTWKNSWNIFSDFYTNGQHAEKAQNSGVKVKLRIGEGLFHCYPVCAPIFPEATEAMKEICDFIKE